MKKKTIEQQMNECRREIFKEIAMWENCNEHGCNDPFWMDGCNMNLLRKHVLYYKNQLSELCEKSKIPLPGEYFFPTPPEVPDNYMANLKQEERVERLRAMGDTLVTKKNQYDYKQLSLF